MSTTPLLRIKLDTEAAANTPGQWTVSEAAVELLLAAITGVGGGDSEANPGSDAAKAVAVQGVTGGKPVAVSDNGGSLTVDGTFWQATQPVSLPTGSQTIARSDVTSSGSIAAGASKITLISSSDFAGTVGGASFPASFTETFTAQPGKTLGALAYTRSAGTLTISTIT